PRAVAGIAMNARRETFLNRVRQAVQEGNRAGQTPPLPARGETGYQGGHPNLVAQFCEATTAAGRHAYVVADGEAAGKQVLELVEARAARRVLLGRDAILETLALPARLRDCGIEVTSIGELSSDTRERLFIADLSITGVDYLIAETGSLAVLTRPDNPRSLS